MEKERFFTAPAGPPAKTVGTWLNYRTPPHSCANRKESEYCSQATNQDDCWGECGPIEYMYEWLMTAIDGALAFATGDLDIDTIVLWNWFLKILTIFFFFVFLGILYRIYGIISTVVG
tara:strand:+ start:2377 stop:2730 length:354 start_codon:yes stop_codon:yes gene_type:complete